MIYCCFAFRLLRNNNNNNNNNDDDNNNAQILTTRLILQVLRANVSNTANHTNAWKRKKMIYQTWSDMRQP